MLHLCRSLWRDETGFIVSAELVLVATISVLAVIVGLSEVSAGINHELEDVGAAIGSLNQSYEYSGWEICGCKGTKGRMPGSRFKDHADRCDGECDLVGAGPQPEHSGGHGK